MPRRRRPRCKVNPSIALRKKNQETAPSAEKVEPQRPPPLPDPPSEEPPETVSTSSVESEIESDYKLFPELYDRQPSMPTFADIFGQPSYESVLEEPEEASTSSTTNTNAAGIRSTDDGKFTNIPATMLTDQFGMIGLLAAMRATHTNPGATQLVFGEDLTTYGLDLAAQGDIYVHFNGPLTREPPDRNSMDCALEMGMRAMRDSIINEPPKAPCWDPFEPETQDLGLKGSLDPDEISKSDPDTGTDPPPTTDLTEDPETDRDDDQYR
ncbi:CCR4-NOT transcription complex subunit 2 isoform X1 [Drosophila sechellia]|uniref:GM25089 n=1 Tax=Drosophila sechellia TaxID=7238 RepID=B4HK26_DROSE|nr:CCR4-NOT transcription complex subunit 2 isoform X1 [Drosophila sechellia]EDW40762.1 GM25089 [Drosophila sechellia]